MNLSGIIRTLISLVVVGAVAAFMYLGPGSDWLSSAANKAGDTMQEAADDAAGKAKRDDDGNISDSGTVDGSSLKVGDCLMAADLGATFYDAEVTPCTEAHDAQVIGDFFPGPTAATDDEMFEGCASEAATYVGPGWDSLGVSLGVITMDRSYTVLCLLETDDGQPTLTQSLEGQGS